MQSNNRQRLSIYVSDEQFKSIQEIAAVNKSNLRSIVEQAIATFVSNFRTQASVAEKNKITPNQRLMENLFEDRHK